MRTRQSIALGMLMGAVITFFLDPFRGRRRRALARDKAVHFGHEVGDSMVSNARHARNRVKGMIHEARARMRPDEATDEVIEERVRSELGRRIEGAGAIEVTARQGEVTLSGAATADAARDVVRTAQSVRGVESVDVQLDVVDESEAN